MPGRRRFKSCPRRLVACFSSSVVRAPACRAGSRRFESGLKRGPDVSRPGVQGTAALGFMVTVAQWLERPVVVRVMWVRLPPVTHTTLERWDASGPVKPAPATASVVRIHGQGRDEEAGRVPA